MNIKHFICALILCASVCTSASAEQIAAPEPQAGSISGTVVDVNNGIIPGATVLLEGPALGENRTVVSGDNGFFSFNDVKPGTIYHVAISAPGFQNWTSLAITLTPGQFEFLTDIRLTIEEAVTSVTVVANSAQIATEQVKLEVKQRAFGIIPNFYVAYDHDAAPLTTKLKFELALKAESDPVTFLGIGVLAASNQAANRLNYVQGAKGYGQRLGAGYADGFTDIMIGGAVLPSLLHQDPRYFYQGTGTKKSRALHAVSSPFICKGDNGRWQPNYSSVGGDLVSASIANSYYPESNRGAGLVLQNSLTNSGGRMVNSLIQEFFLRRFTSNAKEQN